jgi:uncharacterized damage-inducible protein DinB
MYQENLELLRVARGETLRLCEGIGQEQSELAPAQGKWSVGEVLDHLLLTENYYRGVFAQLVELAKSGRPAVVDSSFAEVNTSIAYIPKSVLSALEIPFTVFNRFLPSVVRETIIGNRIIPAQSFDLAQPRKGKPIGELKARLASSYEQTASIFRDNPNAGYRAMRYRHPLMGDNNALQVLRIVSLHERRHQGQIKEILRKCAVRS